MPNLVDTDWAIDYLMGIPEALDLLDRLADGGYGISSFDLGVGMAVPEHRHSVQARP